MMTDIAKFVEENQEVFTWKEGGVRYRLHHIHFTPSGGRWVKGYFSTKDNHWFNQIKNYTHHETHSLIRTMLEDALKAKRCNIYLDPDIIEIYDKYGITIAVGDGGPDPVTVLMEAWRKVNDDS
jgi:hypothetical protein